MEGGFLGLTTDASISDFGPINDVMLLSDTFMCPINMILPIAISRHDDLEPLHFLLSNMFLQWRQGDSFALLLRCGSIVVCLCLCHLGLFLGQLDVRVVISGVHIDVASLLTHLILVEEATHHRIWQHR